MAPLQPWVEAAAASWREREKEPPVALVGPFRDGASRDSAGEFWAVVERALRACGVCFDLDDEHARAWADDWASGFLHVAHDASAIPFDAGEKQSDSARSATDRKAHAHAVAGTLRAAADHLQMRGDWLVDPDSIGVRLFEAMRADFIAAVNAGRRRSGLNASAMYGVLTGLALRMPDTLRAAAAAAEVWARQTPMAPQPSRPGARRNYLLRYLWGQIIEMGEPALEPFAVELAWRMACLIAPTADADLSLRDAMRAIEKWKKSNAHG